jgi:group I intron endonuclease
MAIKRHHLYRITNLANNKIYIGQTVAPSARWRDHRRAAANPKVAIQYAIKKYGNENFEFEVISSGLLPCTCQIGQKGPCQDDANNEETYLVCEQYKSYAAWGNGYNETYGGMNAPKSEAWIQKMKEWRASLSPEEKEERAKMHSEAMIRLIETKGHPALGYKHTPEEIRKRVETRSPIIYTEELRQRMSLAHIGKTDSEEAKKKKSISMTLNWDMRIAEAEASGEIKCNAPGCDLNGGRHHYVFFEGIRYCSTHGQRLKTKGSLELPPRTSHNKGGTSHNRTKFTPEQITAILADTRPLERIGKSYGVTAKVIIRVKAQGK